MTDVHIPRSMARAYALACRAQDPDSYSEKEIFTSFDIDIIPLGWEVEVTFKMRPILGQAIPIDVVEMEAV